MFILRTAGGPCAHDVTPRQCVRLAKRRLMGIAYAEKLGLDVTILYYTGLSLTRSKLDGKHA